jgi:hypothetical protein
MPRDGHKESQLVKIHDVDAEKDLAIQQKDVGRNRRHSGRNMWLPWRTVFPFNEAKLGPKMSKRVIGQFGIRFWSTNERKSQVEG